MFRKNACYNPLPPQRFKHNFRWRGGVSLVGFFIVVRKAPDGRFYGITYIDQENKCVFNGSKLGRNYSSKAIKERCQPKPEPWDLQSRLNVHNAPAPSAVTINTSRIPAIEETASDLQDTNHRLVLLETNLKPQLEQSIAIELMYDYWKKKKQRKRLRI